MRPRPGFGWLVLAVCLIAAGLVLAAVSIARSAELPSDQALLGRRLRPGEIDLLTKVVAAEARGESDAGQRAIAWVALNRLDEPETFGRTLTRVLLAPGQFARPVPIADNSPAYLKAMLATLKALLGEGTDPSGGALYFCRCDLKPMPAWARQFERTARVGSHCFFRPAD